MMARERTGRCSKAAGLRGYKASCCRAPRLRSRTLPRAELSQVPLLPEEAAAQRTCFPKAALTRTCNKWICAAVTPGG